MEVGEELGVLGLHFYLHENIIFEKFCTLSIPSQGPPCLQQPWGGVDERRREQEEHRGLVTLWS